jgi:phosphoglycolate phosphatase
VSGKRPALFFDLDGTLTDPRPGIVRSIQYALERLGHSVPHENELLWCIGPPLKASFIELLGDQEQADQAVALYRERFGETGLYENRVYDGIESLLVSLVEEEFSLYVATSKPHVYATRILEHFGLIQHFDQVFGSELSGERVDKTELLGFALDRTGFRAGGSLMVGDRSHDMIGAHNNEMKTVGVLYGYGSREELESAGAGTIVAQVDDLSNALIERKIR